MDVLVCTATLPAKLAGAEVAALDGRANRLAACREHLGADRVPTLSDEAPTAAGVIKAIVAC